MKVLNCQQMKELELAAIDMGIPGIILMEHAAIHVSKHVSKGPVWIFCGKGQNGGDGFAVARLLVTRGIPVTIVKCFDDHITGDASINYNIVKNMGIPIVPMQELVGKPEIVIDALLGTGLRGPVKGELLEAISFINSLGAYVVSVDIPSGVNGDTGAVETDAVSANMTCTFGYPKKGLLLYPGAAYVGRVRICDISLPQSLTPSCDTRIITPPTLAPFSATVHKYEVGAVLVIGGVAGFSGATYLCSKGAQAGGAGLVFVMSDSQALETMLPEAINYTLSELPLITDKRMKSLVIGPGLGKNNYELLKYTIENCQVPLVVDADAINMLASDLEPLRNKNCPVILTPHSGEMARLSSMDPREFARENGVILVLKGAKTRVYTPTGEVYINVKGNPGMATAGSGDILAGLIAAMCLFFDPLKATLAAVFMHGEAGDIAAKKHGEYSMTASDIAKELSYVVKTKTKSLDSAPQKTAGKESHKRRD